MAPLTAPQRCPRPGSTTGAASQALANTPEAEYPSVDKVRTTTFKQNFEFSANCLFEWGGACIV